MAVRLYDHNNRPIEPVERPTGSVSGVSIDQSSLLLTTAFTTPDQVRAAWTAAAAGNPQILMQVADEIENDPRIGGPLRTRRLAVSLADYVVEPAEGQKPDDPIVKDVEKMLSELDLDEAVSHLQGTVLRPYECLEIIWENFRPVALKPWAASQFRFNWRETGDQFRVLTEANPTEGEPINPLQWVIRLSKEKSFTLPTKRGWIRGLASRYLLKINFLIFAAQFGERFGMPLRIGKYPAGTPDEQIRKLKAALQSLGSDASAVMPDGMLIDIIEASKNSGQMVFFPAIDRLDADCAVAILGGTLTSAGSDGGHGSFANAAIHDDVRDDLKQADGRQISEVLTKQLIAPFVYFQYGPGAPVPRLRFQTDPNADVLQEMQILEVGQRMGLRYKTDEIYGLIGREKPDGTPDVLEPPVQTPAAVPNIFGGFARASFERAVRNQNHSGR